MIDENLLFIIKDIPQIYSIYFHCNQQINYNRSRKIKGFYIEMKQLSSAIERDTQQREIDLISFSILSTMKNETNVILIN